MKQAVLNCDKKMKHCQKWTMDQSNGNYDSEVLYMLYNFL